MAVAISGRAASDEVHRLVMINLRFYLRFYDVIERRYIMRLERFARALKHRAGEPAPEMFLHRAKRFVKH